MKTRKINGPALKNAIFGRGWALAEASRQLNLSANYLSQTIRSGEIKEDRIQQIDTVLGIAPEVYVETVQEETQLEIGAATVAEYNERIKALKRENDELKAQVERYEKVISAIAGIIVDGNADGKKGAKV